MKGGHYNKSDEKRFLDFFLTFEEDDPLFALVVPSDVVSCDAAVVASDAAVVEELSLKSVLLFVSSMVKGLCQFSKRVRRQAFRIWRMLTVF